MRLLILSIFILLAFFANAQNLDSIPVGSMGQAVEIRGKRMHAIQLLESNDNQMNIANQLNQVPGVFMQSGALNTNKITIRGFGSRTPFGTSKIRAYLDDIPLTNGAGETSLEDLDLSFYDRISIRKGPSSSLFGVGLGGMIQLKTPSFTGKKTYLSSTIGSYGMYRQSVGFERGNAEKARSVSVRYSYATQDGYRENNNYDRHALQLKGNFQNWTYLLNFTDLKAEIPSSLNATDFEENPRAAAGNWAAVNGHEDYQKIQFGIGHRLYFGNNDSWNLRTAFFGAYRPAYESRPFNILEENSFYAGIRSRILHQKRLKNGINGEFSAGYELFSEKYDWATFETNGGVQGMQFTDNREIRQYGNVFAESRFTKKDHSLLIGVNLNETTYDVEALDSGFSTDHSFKVIVSPLLQYEFQASNATTLFLWSGHGFSPPSTDETQGPDGRFNDQIKPEQGWNIESGFRYSNQDNGLELTASAYAIFVQDLLVSRRNAVDLWEGVNAGKTRHMGVDISSKYTVDLGKIKTTFQANYAFANHTFIEFIDRNNDYADNPLTGVPAHQTTLVADVYFPKGIQAHLDFLAVSKMPLRDDNSIDSDPYEVVNFQLSKDFSLKNTKLNLDFGIQNLFDAHYARMFVTNASSFGGAAPRYYYPGAERNYYLRVGVNF